MPPLSYVGPSGFQSLRGTPTLDGRSAETSDPQLARRLWDELARLTDTDLPTGAVPHHRA
ncbi:hypothetical protein [Brachybacterium sillae]|uniref:hypothetical protein n=1 Tax=Brachybacterium sillae TaxID=2810536 RepID=UPI00217EF14E|nr:hypothetical protein [Brachybacterium sillae]